MTERLTVFGRSIGSDELHDLTASPEQIAGIRRLRFDGGPERDMRLIEIRNASGLVVNLLPDRCLDLGQVWLNGFPFAWLGANGLPPARAVGGGMDGALGGLMCTCGFDHIRKAVTFDGRDHPQHGSMALKAAVVAAAHEIELDGKVHFVVAAHAAHATLDGQSYTLNRRISVPFDENRIRIEDEVLVRSAGRIAPIMALYHFNLGYPLIADGFGIKVGGAPRGDLAAMGEETLAERAPGGRYDVAVEATHGRLSPCVRVSAKSESLPWLQFHRRTAPGVNLFCIEPTTHDRRPRPELLAEERPLAGSRRKTFELELSLSV